MAQTPNSLVLSTLPIYMIKFSSNPSECAKAKLLSSEAWRLRIAIAQNSDVAEPIQCVFTRPEFAAEFENHAFVICDFHFTARKILLKTEQQCGITEQRKEIQNKDLQKNRRSFKSKPATYFRTILVIISTTFLNHTILLYRVRKEQSEQNRNPSNEE